MPRPHGRQSQASRSMQLSLTVTAPDMWPTLFTPAHGMHSSSMRPPQNLSDALVYLDCRPPHLAAEKDEEGVFLEGVPGRARCAHAQQSALAAESASPPSAPPLAQRRCPLAEWASPGRLSSVVHGHFVSPCSGCVTLSRRACVGTGQWQARGLQRATNRRRLDSRWHAARPRSHGPRRGKGCYE